MMREKRSFRLLSPSLSLPSSHTRSSCARFFGYRSIFRLLPCWFFDLTIVLAVFLLLKPLAFFLMYLELFWGAFLAGTKVRLPVLIEQFTVLSTCDRISISPHSRSSAVLTSLHRNARSFRPAWPVFAWTERDGVWKCGNVCLDCVRCRIGDWRVEPCLSSEHLCTCGPEKFCCSNLMCSSCVSISYNIRSEIQERLLCEYA